MSGFNQAIQTGFGTVSATPTVHGVSIAAVVTKATLCTAALGQVIRVKITNTGTGLIAWTVVAAGAAAPVIVTTAGATCGVIITAGQSEYIVLKPSSDLYFVGNAVASTIVVSSYPVS